ncbi:MAG: hypothetical protein MUC97_15260 [Bernardetiaceae bacterium]|jgi:hypothetical protein|nr:hypothetical protein [Bernardetiaceae bacterium]
MKALIQFELAFFTKRPATYGALLAFGVLGGLAGSNFSAGLGENVFCNSPFAITYLVGFLSLLCLFTATVVAAQVLFRETEAHFALILYALPIQKLPYLASRFLVVFGITALTFGLFLVGLGGGQLGHSAGTSGYGPFLAWHYLHPYLVLALPNAFFCAALACSVGWFSRNKLLLYVSGLFVYIAYWVALIFSGSPLMAGAFPPSPEAMDWAAKLDPFGLSAFMQQTLHWSAAQRNGQVAELAGNLLFNRLLYLALASLALVAVFYRFSFAEARQPKPQPTDAAKGPAPAFRPLVPNFAGARYHLACWVSLVKLNLAWVVRSIPFVLIILGVGFFVGMEIYGEIEKGIRLPQRYATSGLLASSILETFPPLALLVLLFYGNELVWRSRGANFSQLESATPLSGLVLFFSQWATLAALVVGLTTWALLVGLLFQWMYCYPLVEPLAYAGVYYFADMPLVLSAGLLVAAQWLVRHRYAGLAAAAGVGIFTTTSLGRLVGIRHPLLRFGAAYQGEFSDLNGWGEYAAPFGWKLLFGLVVTLLLALLVGQMASRTRKIFTPLIATGLAGLALTALLTGGYFYQQVEMPDPDQVEAQQAAYERHYRLYQSLPQPSITKVETQVDLFPERNAYRATATYTLVNRTPGPLTNILVYQDPEIALQNLAIEQGQLTRTDAQNGHYWLTLNPPLPPGQSRKMQFAIEYAWNTFDRHDPANAIVGNGSFLRLSRYYPQFGYQPGQELTDGLTRQKWGLGAATAAKTLADPRPTQVEAIELDMTISTSAPQTAIGLGELVRTWQTPGRRHFHYRTGQPIPFRFGVSSARYAVQQATHRGIQIEVYYHPQHSENVARLVANAKHTLDYCTQHFGPYPFNTVRFAEISSFTRGFAGTAYPATIFMTESPIFHANLAGDQQQDVINELAAHELSHQWWGTGQLLPDEREGAAFLTETLAMYTELMLIKHTHGPARALEHVKLHHDLYLSNRGFADEQPLYQTQSDNVHQHYSKGLVTMYQLSEIVGEATVNLALRNFLVKQRFPGAAPVSTDLLAEFYAVTDPDLHPKIDELFKQTVTYQFEVEEARYHPQPRALSLAVSARRYLENGQHLRRPQPFTDSVQIALHYANQPTQIKKIAIQNGQGAIRLAVPTKPQQIEVDPFFRYLHRGLEGRTRKVD